MQSFSSNSLTSNNNTNKNQQLFTDKNHNNKLNHGVMDLSATRKWSGKNVDNNAGVIGKKEIGFGSTPIHRLPTEILAHIFAQLTPRELGIASLVNRAWRDIIADEGSWKSAFENYFKILDDGLALGRRLDSNRWRSEYINRVSLLTRWSKSRTATVIHDPLKSAPITAIHITFPPANLTKSKPIPFGTTSTHPSSQNLTPSRSTSTSTPTSSSSSPFSTPNKNSNSQPHPTLISISLPFGVATKSDPYTGKVSKSTLEATPLDNVRQPIGLPLVMTTCFSISPDGIKLVFGCQDGNFRIINTNLTNPTNQSGQAGINARAWAGIGADGMNNGVRALLGHVGGEVHKITFSTLRSKKDLPSRNDVFASVGVDGVGIWLLGDNVREVPGRKIWSGKIIKGSESVGREIRNGTASTAMIGIKATAIAFDSGWNGKYTRSSSLVVGMEDGTVHIWTGITLEGSIISREKAEENYLRILDRKLNECGAINKLILDQVPGSLDFCLLIHQKQSKEFYKYTFTSDSSAGSLVLLNKFTFGQKKDYLGIPTAFAVDFDEPPPLSSANGIITGIIIPPDDFPPLASTSTFPTSTSLGSVDSDSSIITDQEDSTTTFPSSSNESQHGSNVFGRRKFVVAGDNQGGVFIWDWDTKSAGDQKDGEIVLSRRMIQGFESRVTALEITTAVIFVGGLDGTIRAYDPLTSTLLRAFKDRSASRLPSRMLAAGLLDSSEEERWQVSMIRADSSGLVAAVGGKILAWRIAEEVFGGRRKGGGGGGRGSSSGRMSARGERVQSEYEFRQEVKESLNKLSDDSNARISRISNERRVAIEYGIPPTLDNMTEEEAVALALMLSVEDEEERMMNDLDLDGFSLDEGGVTQYGSRSSRNSSVHSNHRYEGGSEEEEANMSSYSLSIPNSPYLSASQSYSHSPSSSNRNWIPQSPSQIPYEPHSYNSNSTNYKLQLSPRLGPTYGSSSNSSSNFPSLRDIIPDLNEESFPELDSTNSGEGAQSFVSSSPLLSYPSLALSRDTIPATPPVKRGWNEVARTPTSGSRSPTPFSSSSSSSITAATSGSSMLSNRLREYGTTVETRERTQEEREEEELRFVLELSQVEEKSRLDL